ncbi:MAG: ribbon-helix-helix protein, CopG family [Chloroflexi bacterium]|nr:ribbon-helix-helix protein, CopG family [Chloroflexota bacterium]
MSHRTQITLTDEQYARLREESRRSGLGLAELVRRALDRSYGTAPGAELLNALDASFASWEDRDFDGASYVEELRRGMSRRLAD